MRLSVEQSLPVRPDELMTLMSDEEFVVFRASVESTTVEGRVVDPAADGSLRITLRRTMPTTQIPVQVRAFVGSRLEVRHVERTGSDALLSLAFGGRRIIVRATPAETAHLRTGDRVAVAFPRDRLNLFDARSGRRI